jgi:hypothetical protein
MMLMQLCLAKIEILFVASVTSGIGTLKYML